MMTVLTLEFKRRKLKLFNEWDKVLLTLTGEGIENYMQLPMPNLKDITDPTAAINMALALMVKAFKLKYSTPTNNNKRISSNPRKRQITQPGNQNGNGNVVLARAKGNANGNNAEGDLRKFSDIGAWVQVPRCMTWLDYDEHVDNISTMDNEVGVTSPESTTQTLPSFEEYTPLVTYPEEVENSLGTPIEVEPLNETKLEEVGLNCNHNTPLSSREVPSFDGPEPQPLLNSPSLDVSLGDVMSPEPPIKPHSPDTSRMKVIFDEKKLGSS
ncbi:hypothetical protein Tco_0427616 [Tanacetum coccineum]